MKDTGMNEIITQDGTLEVIEGEQRPLTPMDLITRAIDRGAAIDVLEKLMALQERAQGWEAKRAFESALADAKGEIPVIEKNRSVNFTTARGRTSYRFEDLGQIAEAINPILGKYGLSYRWRTQQNRSEGTLRVICVISHRNGHSEENSLETSLDQTGSKNDQQALGSAVTYLARYTLKAALGLVVAEDDDAQSVAGRKDGDAPRSEKPRESSPAEAVNQAQAYVQRWTIALQNALSATSMIEAWNSERQLRNTIFDINDGRYARLKAAVFKRVEELKKQELAEAEAEAKADSDNEQAEAEERT